MFRHVACECFSIKAGPLSVARKILILEGLLVREQFVVHLPEFFLWSSSLRSFRSTQRMRMSSHSWEVTKDKAQIVTQKFLQLLDYWIGTSAVDALEVAILDQRHGGALRARNVVAIGNRVLESNDLSITHKQTSCHPI